MRYGFDYITSGSYAGDWSELYFPVDTTVTLTTTKGDSITTTFTEGTSIVGTYVGINISSGGIIAYKRSDTEKILLQDPAITALLAQAATDGYTAASGATLTALDTYVKGLKADGIWDKLDLLYVFATNGDSDFATYNIKDPSNFQATKVNAPTFTSLEGFTGDGASAYLNTNYQIATDATNFTLDSASFGGYVRQKTTPAADTGILGARIAFNNTETVLFNRATGTYLPRINQDGGNDLQQTAFVGLVHINRTASNATQFYSNGTSIDTATTASSAIPDLDMYLLALNQNGSAGLHSDVQLSIAFAGADLSAEASDFYTRTQNYMTALGKEV